MDPADPDLTAAAVAAVLGEFQVRAGVALRPDQWDACRSVLEWLVGEDVADPEKMLGYIRFTLATEDCS